jgi:transposase
LEGKDEMKKLPKQEYTAEFKELAVKQVKAGQSNGVVAKALGVSDQTLRNWVNAFDAGKLTGSGTKVVTPEQMEMSRMRAENARLRMENDILKKATAYFAKDVL